VFLLALAVFCVSGAAALLYQVIWQRVLTVFSGADVFSATIIVAAFMGGLGLGTLAGGHVADRVSRRTSLMLVGAAEVAVGVFGFFSAWVYHDVLYARLGEMDLGRETVAAVLFVSLLWPTFFMGASLPLCARALTHRIDRAAAAVGALYGINTLGAAAGALVATWTLLPAYGLHGSLRIGAALNILCALAVLPVAWSMKERGEADAVERERRVPDGVVTQPASARILVWVLVCGFSGFVALSYEIVWFRLLGVVVKSTAFTFGTLLTLYLLGIGLGALAGSGRASRSRHPARTFFTLQAAGGLSAGALLGLLVFASEHVPVLRGYFDGYEPLNVRDAVEALRTLVGGSTAADGAEALGARFLGLYVVVPLLLVVPPTFLMGYAFPYLQRVAQTDLNRIGRRVGALLLANIAGSMLGTLLTGWVFLSLLGTAATLKLLTALSSLFLLGAWREMAWGPRAVPAALAVAAVTLIAMMPGGVSLWARLHGTTVDRVIVAEDHSGLAVIKARGERLTGQKIVFVNGVGQSVIPYGDIHTALGALPALVHPSPRDIAIIGLGSGDTVFAASARAETAALTAIEIIQPQLVTLRQLAARDSYAGLQGLLADPRVRHVAGDGRAFLLRTRQRFDIIEADALRPTSAYSGNLYSEEYFTLLRDRLKPNGLAATWAPTKRVHDTFVRVFPYGISLPGIMLGSTGPVAFDRAVVASRAADPRVRAHFRRAGLDIEELVGQYLAGPSATFDPAFDRGVLTDVNTDLFPKDEFDLATP
jgi:spermidine synthase/MFS family permease